MEFSSRSWDRPWLRPFGRSTLCRNCITRDRHSPPEAASSSGGSSLPDGARSARTPPAAGRRRTPMSSKTSMPSLIARWRFSGSISSASQPIFTACPPASKGLRHAVASRAMPSRRASLRRTTRRTGDRASRAGHARPFGCASGGRCDGDVDEPRRGIHSDDGAEVSRQRAATQHGERVCRRIIPAP